MVPARRRPTHLQLQADYSGNYRGLSAQFSGDGFADMRFVVDAVPSQEFDRWVTSTRGNGPALNPQSYADLARPSKVVAPFTYGAVSPDLFNRIVNLAMAYDTMSRAGR
jgi:cytochrome o ubiquinol oxidase subunit 2